LRRALPGQRNDHGTDLCLRRLRHRHGPGRPRLSHRLRRWRRLLQQAEPARPRAARPVRREPLGSGAGRDRPALHRKPGCPRGGPPRPAAPATACLPVRQRLGHPPAQLHLHGRRDRGLAGHPRRRPGLRRPAPAAVVRGSAAACPGAMRPLFRPRHRLRRGRLPRPPAPPSPPLDGAPRPGRAARGAAVTGPPSLSTEPTYEGYAYASPHKTAYRPLRPPVPLREAWAGERRDALFLYLHVPFCEMRCGFCNLFTLTWPKDGLAGAYLAALRRQAARGRDALGDARFARVAVGGGTPTFLDGSQLAELFDI